MNRLPLIVEIDEAMPARHDGDSELRGAAIAAHAAHPRTVMEQRHWQVIGLLSRRRPIAEIVAATGYRPRTIRHIAQRYREAGPAGLAARRRPTAGAAPLLTPAHQRELQQVLQVPPEDGGVWTGPKVARWMAAKTGRRVHRQRGWEYLRRLGDDAATTARSNLDPSKGVVS